MDAIIRDVRQFTAPLTPDGRLAGQP